MVVLTGEPVSGTGVTSPLEPASPVLDWGAWIGSCSAAVLRGGGGRPGNRLFPGLDEGTADGAGSVWGPVRFRSAGEITGINRVTTVTSDASVCARVSHVYTIRTDMCSSQCREHTRPLIPGQCAEPSGGEPAHERREVGNTQVDLTFIKFDVAMFLQLNISLNLARQTRQLEITS